VGLFFKGGNVFLKMKDYLREVQIGDSIWEIRFCKKIPDEPATTIGLCDPSEHTIYIKLGQSPQQRFKTFIHELCHAVCYEYGIPECHKVIYALEEPIYRLFADNGVIDL
jgi:hypothetical protein